MLTAWFMEHDRTALAALRANVASIGVGRPGLRHCWRQMPRPPPGNPCGLIFLDPPYAQGFGPRAMTALAASGWVAPGAVLALEIGRDEEIPEMGERLAERVHGAARITLWRVGGAPIR